MTREARLIETRDVDLDDIEVEGRLRPVSPASVNALRASIEAIGLQSEIHLRKVAHQGGRLKLIAGGHRVVAFRKMGRDTIPAKIWDCTDDWAKLAEIDDNLAHAELDTLELAVFLAERKAVYERMHPETKAATGAELVAKRWDTTDNMSVVSFATATAQKMGVNERTVFRLLAVGTALDGEAISHLRGAPKKVTLADLQLIAKCQPNDRPIICRELGLGKAKSAKEVMSRRKDPKAKVQEPVEKELRKLLDAFARSSKAARKRFVKEHRDTLGQLITEVDGDVTAEVVHFKAKARG